MYNTNIKTLAKEIKIPIMTLIKKLSDLGIYKSVNDVINYREKGIIIKHLKNEEDIKEKLIIKRKKLSIYNIHNINGTNKSVQIEIRKKHTYIKNIKKNKKNTSKIKNLLHQINDKNEINNKKNEIKNTIKNKNEESNKKQKNKNKEKEQKKINRNVYINKKNNKQKSKNLLRLKINEKNIKEKNNLIKIKNKKENRVLQKQNNKIKNRKEIKTTVLKQKFKKPKKNKIKNIKIGKNISIIDLAKKVAIKTSKIKQIILNMGIELIKNKSIDQETAQLIIEELGHKVTLFNENSIENTITQHKNKNKPIIKIRPPIVSIMGHVDHGKTSLLKYINANKVLYKEDGNITQNLHSYQINTKKGLITFIDTPGHAAFTTMRSKGTKITDIIVLIIAADDGVMPQTIEVIQQAQKAKIPIIVAINKIDLIKSKIEDIKKELTKYNIISEDWGGENLFVEISTKSGQGINKLLDNIILQAEILELKTNINTLATGIVIESYLDKQKGPVINVITKEGILKHEDIILCGTEYGKIKAISNEFNKKTNKVFPSVPVKILGLSGIPNVGDVLNVVNNEKIAKKLALHRKKQKQKIKFNQILKEKQKDIFNNKKIHKINLLIKANNHGQLEAILNTIYKLNTKKIKINVISYNIGWITETDINLAITTKSIIFGFNVKIENTIKKIVKKNKIHIKYHKVIYKLIEDIKSIINNFQKQKDHKTNYGIAEVKNIFQSPKFGIIAGCVVKKGTIKNLSKISLIRNDTIIYNGRIESLRKFKVDVQEVKLGSECGITIKNLHNIMPGDIIKTSKI